MKKKAYGAASTFTLQAKFKATSWLEDHQNTAFGRPPKGIDEMTVLIRQLSKLDKRLHQ